MATSSELVNTENVPKGLSMIEKAKEEDAAKREILEQLLSQTAVCLHGVVDEVLSVVKEDLPDVFMTFEERIKRLQQRDYYILVAGETSAGKSCLINLLLGDDLLPYSVLSTTSTICEIKYGEQPTLIAHFKNNGNKPGPPLRPKVLKLEKQDVCGQSYREQIDAYVHRRKDREEGSVYEKVEIFWPHELLKVGVVIIDSPGVGESEKMDQILMDYLPKAFAFIYVICSSNAGGIQKDRLVRILDKVRGTESRHEMDFNGLAECALFVANKWDQVDEDERSEVKQYVGEELKKFWPDGNPDEQTIYISTKDALKQQKQGKSTEQYGDLVQGINSMILKAINGRLHNHWEWLSMVLDRIVCRIEGFEKCMLQDRDTLVKQMGPLHRKILMLQDARHQEIAELKEKLQNDTENVVNKLYDFLCSDEFETKFTSWENGEMPAVEDTWILNNPKIKKAVEKKFETLLGKWEERNGIYATVHEELVQCFHERFCYAEEEIKNIEDGIHGRHSQSSSAFTEKESVKPVFNARFKSIKQKASTPLWVTVGVLYVIAAIPAFAVGKCRQNISERKEFEKYRRDQKGYLTKRSKKFLSSVTSSKDQVRKFVNEQMHLVHAMLQEYVSRIPRMLEANRRMVSELMKNTRSKDDAWRSNLSVLDKCMELQGSMYKFGISIWSDTVSSNRLTWSEDSLIGHGEFSSVYSGVLQIKDYSGNAEDHGSVPNVVVKVFKEPLDSKNASYFMRKESALRELQHDNLCKFLGAIILKDRRWPEDRVALVMEKYPENLRSVIFNDDYVPPASAVDASSPSVVRFLHWASQLANALAYIHDMKFIHKHLKLENMLVDQSECIKLSDIGIICQNGVTEKSMIYVAPEVLNSSHYSAASDVYTLGLVFWEMWYRTQVFSEILPLGKLEFVDRVGAQEYRPRHPEREFILQEVQTLLHYCWAAQEEMRVTASRCYSFLLDIKQKYQINDM